MITYTKAYDFISIKRTKISHLLLSFVFCLLPHYVTASKYDTFFATI